MSKFIISGFSDEISENIDEQFKHLNKLDITHFEVRGVNGENISELSAQKVSELKEKMNEYGISVSSIGSPIGKIKITDNFDEHLELLKKIIETAKLLGTKFIRVFSFYVDGKYEESREEVMRRMKAMTETAEKEGVVLLHENEKGIYGDMADRCFDILKTVNSENLKAVFDPANFVQCGETTYPKAFELLKPYVVYMHIKDALENGDVVPAGYGKGHVKEIISDLSQLGYEGFLSLEPHLGSFKGLDALEEDDKMTMLDGATPEKFTLAYSSLMNILNEVEK